MRDEGDVDVCLSGSLKVRIFDWSRDCLVAIAA